MLPGKLYIFVSKCLISDQKWFDTNTGLTRFKILLQKSNEKTGTAVYHVLVYTPICQTPVADPGFREGGAQNKFHFSVPFFHQMFIK